VVEGG